MANWAYEWAVKEQQIVSKILQTIPLAAKQIGLEGEVVAEAVIDATGKVTT